MPLFDILDRLDSQVIEGIHLKDTWEQKAKRKKGAHSSNIATVLRRRITKKMTTKDSVTHANKSFLVHLLPTRNVESNHVRSVIELHCEACLSTLRLCEISKNLYPERALLIPASALSNSFFFRRFSSNLHGSTLPTYINCKLNSSLAAKSVVSVANFPRIVFSRTWSWNIEGNLSQL